MEQFIIALLSISAGFFLGRLSALPKVKGNYPERGYKIVSDGPGRASMVITDRDKWNSYMNRYLNPILKSYRRYKNETK